MDKVQLLERYYNTFIELGKPKDFFIGMTDYLDYADSLPELENFASTISASKNILVEKLNETQKSAVDKLNSVRIELLNYIKEHKIENPAIDNALKEYSGWLDGKIYGSQSMPDALHDNLRDVIEFLYRMPEHKAFVEKWIEYSSDKSYIRFYFPLREYQTYRDIEDKIEEERKTALWAQLDEISSLYLTIKTGRQKLSEMTTQHKAKGATSLAWSILNHRLLLEDWEAIEYGTRSPYFFKIEKIKPMIQRIHNHILTRLLIGQTVEKAISNITTTPTISRFKPQLISKKMGKNKVGFLKLYDEDKPHRIAGVSTRQFLLVQCLFSPENKIEASYSPTFHTYDGVYDSIQLPKDKRNARLFDSATKNAAMRDIIEWTIKEIQKNKKIRDYLKFQRETHRMRMEITLPEGEEKEK